ncbi:hypothetical protein CVU82_00390 [Candidatus Falkowbacteria bacterium HGW-Falkowbacteria-1]|uniref:DUF5667 domain-containing protein n=1 Tax=Candidatus Falkowbacteria bacterium HGW-Falkowbacteria-1 TaxID=2013768 RepID=A0A2N2EAA4_9BACT|nr:MAG: hypothetical protein CVU82_00390 [Candidatus Falkowbacteria bacterium HGW-Falkowbacteria-1]
MTDKELLKQLNSLKSIRMEENLKESNKRVLLTQISNTVSENSEAKPFNNFFFFVKNILAMSSRPAMVLSGVFLFLFASLILGSDFYKNSKPTDSLYIARVLSERARLNTTFDQTAKEKLAVKFASQHAKDIATLLMDPEFNKEENREEVEKLSVSFKSEIEKVRGNINANEATSEIKEDVDSAVFSASSLREENGTDVYIEEENFKENSDMTLDTLKDEEKITVSNEDIVLEGSSELSSTSEEVKELGEKIEELNGKISDDSVISKELLEEIESLFENGKYDEVLLKLNNIK